MKRTIVLFLLIGGCNLPPRDNGADPAIRPQARLTLRALEVVASAAEADLVVEGVFLRSLAEPRGDTDAWFVADARDSSDPNQSSETLAYAFSIGGIAQPESTARAVCPGAAGSSGTPSPACYVLRPEEVRAVVTATGIPVRNAPIAVDVTVADAEGHVHMATKELLVADTAPVADAGADVILPLKSCAPGPACTHTAYLDAVESRDDDPIPADVTAPISSYCWEEIPAAGASCTVLASATVVDPSPVDTCPTLSTDAACLRPARSLTVQVSAAALPDGSSPSARFRLWAADRYAWSRPDITEIRVGSAALWFQRSAGAVRQPASFYRYAREGYPNVSEPYRPTIANGPDGDYAYILSDEGPLSNMSWAHRLTSGGFFEYFGCAPSNEGYELEARAAAHDASGRLWVALRAEDTTYPGHLFLAMTTGNAPYSSPTAVGECSFPTPNAFCTMTPPDFLAANGAEGTAFGAHRDGAEVSVFSVNGSAISVAPLATTFTSIRTIETAEDGRLFVSDGTGAAARVRIFAQGAETGEITGLGEVDAIRVDGEEVWANVPDFGIWQVSLADPNARTKVSEPLGPIGSLRISPDGRIWAQSSVANELYVVDPAAPFLPPETVSLDGVATGTSGILRGKSPFVSVRAADVAETVVVRLPEAGALREETSPNLGVLRSLSADPDGGGAWFAFSNPPSVVQAATDGSTYGATRFDRLTIQGTEIPLTTPWRIAADPASRALWIVDVEAPSSANVTARWLLADRAPAGAPGAVTGLASGVIGDDEPDEIVHSLRAGASGVNASAWAFVEDEASSQGAVVHMRRNGSTFTRTRIVADYPAGPATAADGTAWFAKCQAPGSAFNFDASCNCQLPNNASFCSFGIRLAFALPGATSVTNWVPGTELGTCAGAGTLCSVFPIDVAYDRERNALWLAALDHADSAPPNQFRFWRFSCSTGGSLRSCAPANIRAAQRVPETFDDPLQTDFSLPNYSYMDLARETPELLSVDPGTGMAYFLDPLTRVVHILAYDAAPPTPVIRRVGSFDVPGAVGVAIDR